MNTVNKQLLETTLSDKQKLIVDDMPTPSYSIKTANKIQSVLGNNSFTHFPLPDSNIQPDADVAEHLHQHGYDIHDYAKGIASKKVVVGNPERGIPYQEKIVKHSIGNILEKTGASSDVIRSFQHDPNRRIDANKQHIVISKTPYAVAGMSTGTHWTSCMNLNSGSNSHFIPHDLRHGTHVAYLVNHDDHDAFKYGEPSKPIARIAIKPFHEEDGMNTYGDTIFRAENSAYGNSNPAFQHAVSRWCIEHYPAKPNTVYYKNEKTYNDDGNSEYEQLTPDVIKSRMNSGKSLVYRPGASMDTHSIDVATEHLKELAKQTSGGNDRFRNAADDLIRVGNLSVNHINSINNTLKENLDPVEYKNHFEDLAVIHGNKFSTKLHQQFHDLNYGYIPNKVLMSPKLPEHVVDAADPDELNFIQRNKIKPHHVDKLIDHVTGRQNKHAYLLNDFDWAMQPHHLKKLLDNNIHFPWMYSHPNFNKDMHDQQLAKGNPYSHELLFKHSKHATFDDVDKLSESQRSSAFTHLSKNENISEESKQRMANYYMDSLPSAPTKNIWQSKHISMSIPESIGDKLDFDKIANHLKFVPRIKNVDHSEKYIAALRRKAQASDDAITQFHNGSINKNPEEEHENNLDNYYSAIDNHIDDFIDPGYDEAFSHHVHGTRADRILKELRGNNGSFEHDTMHDTNRDLIDKVKRIVEKHED